MNPYIADSAQEAFHAYQNGMTDEEQCAEDHGWNCLGECACGALKCRECDEPMAEGSEGGWCKGHEEDSK